MKILRTALVVALSTMTLACGSDEPSGLLSKQECNPMGGNNCITPWPSNLYAVEDTSTVSGMRLDIPEGALPTNLDGFAIDPTPLNALDGFSAAAPMIVSFEGGVDASNLVPNSNYAASLEDSSPTVILDMSTGERVLHFAELDIRDPERTDKQALYLRPAVRLKPSTRYAAAIRKSLKGLDGEDLPISPGFEAILSGKSTKHARLEERRADYDAVLSAFEDAGVPSEDLVVAWDFTTASDESIRRQLIAGRDRVLEAAGDKGANLSYQVDKDETNESGSRRIDGFFTAPLILTNDGEFAPATKVSFDAEGLPEVVGMREVPFTALIPECALSAQEPVAVIIYGHGLLGDEAQAASGSQRDLSNTMCAVLIGTIMRGMSNRDIPNVLLTLNDYNLADRIFDTMLQGILHHISLVQAVRGPMAEGLFVDELGESIVDIERIYYYGLSQGGIFGATVAAYDPHITRAALGVGAANYSMMLERSQDWPTYRTVVIGAYDDPLNVSIIVNLMQMRWDTTEPTNVIADLPGSPIPGTPEKQFLMHVAVADTEVPNLASEYQARTMGLPVLEPAVRVPFGIPEMPGPLSNALVYYDGGFGEIPDGNVPPEENEAHSLTRSVPAGVEQIAHFFDTGEIVHTCGEGIPCDCTTGACD